MDNNSYLVPANAKKGTLILNVFRPFDAALFGGGLLFSLLALAVVPSSNVIIVIICCLPVAITGFLVLPIPHYHNVLTALQSIINFYTNRRMYVWKGWCFYERFVNEQSNSKQ